MFFLMEATMSTLNPLALPHVVFMTGGGHEVFHRTRDCGHLGAGVGSDGTEVYAVGRASAQAVGRVPCDHCFG